ncbi:MAG: glycosyltransferase [Caldilineaceae bacterium]
MLKPMNILFIVPYAPNLIRVRSYQLIRSLAERRHQVTVATLWMNEEEQADLQHLSELGVRVVAQQASLGRSLRNTLFALPTRTPLQAVFSWHPGLADEIRTLLQTEVFDVVHVEHLRGSRYGLLARSIKRQDGSSTPVVWDSVDCISHLFQQAVKNSRSLKGRLLTGLDLKRTEVYEGQLVHAFDRVLVTSPTDKTALEKLAAQVRASQPYVANGQGGYPHLHVLPNGVNLDGFTPPTEPREPETIVFSGKMSYHANVTAVLHLIKEIMPQVWAKRPSVKVWIVGKDPVAEVRRLENANVTVTGTVPALPPYLQKATLAVAPIPYGAGIQNKVLEAMACATTVVASPQASSALQVQGGRELLVAQNADAFAQAILLLLADPATRDALGQAGRAYVERCHAWHAIVAQLEQLYAAAMLDHQQYNRLAVA